MKKYQLISKDINNRIFVMFDSDNFDFIYNAYKHWKSNCPNDFFAISTIIEV